MAWIGLNDNGQTMALRARCRSSERASRPHRGRPFSHEPSSSERFDIRSIKIEPFSSFPDPLRLKTIVPIRFDADWIVGADHMHIIRGFGELDLEFAFTPTCSVAPAYLVVFS